jgi:dTDP-4-dehydrorhamnose reductase
MKILLLGKNGQVGWELQRSLAPLGELVALDRRSSALCGNMEDLAGLIATMEDLRPNVVVNAAAYTAVDKAEGDAEMAHRINAEAPGVLAAEAARIGAWMVHYSTDYVFDGSGTTPWREDDATAPASVYGRTKAMGERFVSLGCERHLIFRTSWVYAARGGNFMQTMLRLAQERDRLAVVNDQFGAPTGAELIADITAHAIRDVVAGRASAGTYHLAAGGETSWHGYAEYVIAAARRSTQAERIKAQTIDPVPASAYKTAAQRPHNSRLDTQKLQRAFGLQLPAWQQGVDRVLTETGWPQAAVNTA